MITSTENPQVKNIIRLAKKARERKRQNVFLAEGIRMFQEIPARQRVSTYVSESFLQKDQSREMCRQVLQDVSYEMVSDAVFARMSDTQTPQGILCIARRPAYELQDLLEQKNPCLLVLEDMQDPGNLGTIFRTGEGAGITGIIMNQNCVDWSAPKTVRSTMGSIFRVPFYITQNLQETLEVLKSKQIMLYAAAARTDTGSVYDAMDYRNGTAFLIGNEGNGLNDETAAMADAGLWIPMEGGLESLNAAMAAGILMYEVNRQRRQHDSS